MTKLPPPPPLFKHRSFTLNALSLTISILLSIPAVANISVTKKDLGTLEANNQGNSSVNAVNADGTVITGMSDSHKSRNLDALNRATVWLGNNHNTKLELPHAVSTGSKYYLLDTPVDVKAQTPFLSAVSHDGKVIAGNNPISKNGIVFPKMALSILSLVADLWFGQEIILA